MKKLILLLLIIGSFIACTDNQMTRQYGGNMNITILPGEKLINLTWKTGDLWILTQDTLTKAYYFREKSAFGIMEGEVTIK